MNGYHLYVIFSILEGVVYKLFLHTPSIYFVISCTAASTSFSTTSSININQPKQLSSALITKYIYSFVCIIYDEDLGDGKIIYNIYSEV